MAFSVFTCVPAFCQTVTQKYNIEVAGFRMGTMTVAQITSPNSVVYDQVSDVEFWFFGKVKIYYKTVSRFDPTNRQLLQSNIDAVSNHGNYQSAIVWQKDHYDINVRQYKYERKATEWQPIEFTAMRLYYEEPVGRTRVFAEYFGNYATIERTKKGSYRVRIDDREDEYFYEKGKLIKVVKKNSIKNFVIRLIE
ncbi:hypothetical protein GJJ30_00400 [Larkinella terrae]|uniref:DUF3108 domain-containing protein n=1 Tax=Larkinella terrae TaxID=2025311 RepID=A0A7K0ECS0_9BACT|nr:hypothetical protein [Larkinella terrae]